MKELFWETITGNMRLVLDRFSRTGIGARFYLAGGTGLSLQIGHRRSVDLDFFSPTEDIPAIRKALEESLAGFQPTLTDSDRDNLLYLARDVRIGFYGYGYPLVASLIETEGLRLASLEDIALMKLDTLLSRSARRDLYDLYFICRKIPLRQLLDLAPLKYARVRDFEVQTVKRLVYFDNGETDMDPVLFHPVAWHTVTEFFIQQAREISSNWL